MMDTGLNASQMMAKMLRKRLFVAIRSPVDAEKGGEILASHLQWAIDAERRGELFMSGPFLGGAAPGELGGMTLIRAGTEEEARTIMNSDPFIIDGVFTFELREWMVMEGSISINVNFSDKSVKVF
nr:YciI family protein [uncultured Cupriavidus sp.]